jgi:hypothetical protein
VRGTFRCRKQQYAEKNRQEKKIFKQSKH